MASSAASQIVTFEEFEANFRSRELRRHGAKVKLPDQSFQVLVMLLERPGELVTREELHTQLWPADTFIDFDHGLNNAVNRLREALGDAADNPRFAETLPRRGYRFIGTTNGAAIYTPGVSDAKNVPAGVLIQKDKGTKRWMAWTLPPLLVLILVAIVWLWPTSVPSSRSFVLPPEGTTFDLIGDGGGAIALSPDGANIAFVADDSRGNAQIWVRPLSKLSADPIPGTLGATFPFWSADGQSLGFFADGQLKKVAADGKSSVKSICDAPFGRGGSWNSRGVIIFAPDSHSGIYRVSDSGGTPTQITVVDTAIHTTHRWPRFLPDSNHFIYLAVSHFRDASHNGIFFGSLEKKENRFVVSTDADATYASGYLFFIRNDTLVAQEFDPESGKLNGEARPTPERALYDPIIWKAVFDVSEHSVMAYQLGKRVTGNHFYWFDRAGKEIGSLGEPIFQFEPSISRDGRRLAVGIANGGYSNVWVYDLDRGGRMQITFTKYDHGSPVWSPDGRRIFFAGKRQHYSVYEVDANGVTPEQLILDLGNDAWPAAVSPDGRFLLFCQGVNVARSRSQLWAYPLNGKGKPFRVVNDEAIVTDGQFSPDAHWIAYTSDESGKREVYVSSFNPPSNGGSSNDIGSSQKSQISISGGRWPRWRRDGKELYYLAPDNTLTAVPVLSRGSALHFGVPHPLFHANPSFYNFAYDVSPNGNRFVINSSASEKTAPITLVQNWLSDFRK